MYSPVLWRFLQTDPVGYAADLNWYAYVDNNPVNLTDPDGTNPVSDAVKAIIKTFEPGPFAGKSIPATGPRASSAETKAVTEIDKDTGCHICGTTDPGMKSGNFIADHMKPTSIAGGEPQRLYPSCLACSNTQGGFLSGLTKTAAANATAVVSTVANAATALYNDFKNDPLGFAFYTLQSSKLGDATLKHGASGF
jgi:hypothetical protein